jgi:hypothetical protein
MSAPVSKHAKNLVTAIMLYPHQIGQKALFEIMQSAADELDRQEAELFKAKKRIKELEIVHA